MRVCFRTIVFVYVLQVVYLALLLVDHRQDLREMSKVVWFMYREFRR